MQAKVVRVALRNERVTRKGVVTIRLEWRERVLLEIREDARRAGDTWRREVADELRALEVEHRAAARGQA